MSSYLHSRNSPDSEIKLTLENSLKIPHASKRNSNKSESCKRNKQRTCEFIKEWKATVARFFDKNFFPMHINPTIFSSQELSTTEPMEIKFSIEHECFPAWAVSIFSDSNGRQTPRGCCRGVHQRIYSPAGDSGRRPWSS